MTRASPPRSSPTNECAPGVSTSTLPLFLFPLFLFNLLIILLSFRQIGDIALLLGSPKDAQVRYNESIEDSKRENDVIWTAAAQEDLASAHFSQIRTNLPGTSLSEVTEGEEVAWLNEATQLMATALETFKKKPAPTLFIELSLKAARYPSLSYSLLFFVQFLRNSIIFMNFIGRLWP